MADEPTATVKKKQIFIDRKGRVEIVSFRGSIYIGMPAKEHGDTFLRYPRMFAPHPENPGSLITIPLLGNPEKLYLPITNCAHWQPDDEVCSKYFEEVTGIAVARTKVITLDKV